MTPEQESDDEMAKLAAQLGITDFDVRSDKSRDELDKRARANGTNALGVSRASIAAGPEYKPRRSPAMGQAQSVLEKLGRGQSQSNNSMLKDFNPFAGAMAGAAKPPAPDAVPQSEGPIADTNSSPPSQMAAMVTGAMPQQRMDGPPQTPAPSQEDSQLIEAQRRARGAEREAQYAKGMGQAADMIQGTHYNDHAGEDIRAAGQQGVKDVLTQRGEGRANQDQELQVGADRRARQNQDFNQGLATDEFGIKKAGEGRTQKSFADSQAELDPGSQQSKAIRAQVVALYPKIAAKIPPGEFNSMSAHDLKALLGELPVKEPGMGGGGRGGSGAEDKEVLQRVKMIPKNTKGVHDMLDNLDATIKAVGGPDNIQGIGGPFGLAALRPGMTMDPQSQAFHQMRQEVSNMHSNQLFGSALSPTEAARFDKAVADVSAGHSMEQVMGGMQIIRDITDSAYEQAMAGATPGAKARIGADMKITPGGGHRPPGGGGGMVQMRDPQTGEVGPVPADRVREAEADGLVRQ